MTAEAANRPTLPPYPSPPVGVTRSGHAPTIRAAVRYWKAVQGKALADGDAARARTADALVMSYMAMIPCCEWAGASAGR